MVGDQQSPTVSGNVSHTVDFDPPPDVVKKLKQREDGFGELLVEPPLVLVVLAAKAIEHGIERRAEAARQGSGCMLGRGHRVEAGLDAAPQHAQEVGDRLRRHSRLRTLAHAATRVPARRLTARPR